jgi:hypothetical protein
MPIGGAGYPFYDFLKMTDFIRPGPVNTFVLLDESRSINDGWFMASMDGFDPRVPAQQEASGFGDAPGAWHAKACGFSFADGHSEIHKWRAYNLNAKPSADDVDWMQSKTTAKKGSAHALRGWCGHSGPTVRVVVSRNNYFAETIRPF